MPEDSPRVQVPPQVGIIDRFEHAIEKLVQALEKVDIRSKIKDAKLKVIKHVKAKKPRIRALKLEYKLVDEVYVSSCIATTLLMSPV